MPNITFVHEGYGTETAAQMGLAIAERLKVEKQKVRDAYVVAPAFSAHYANTRHPNGKDFIITVPYKFADAPVLKSSAPAPQPRRAHRKKQ